jgi:hypothetical protein
VRKGGRVAAFSDADLEKILSRPGYAVEMEFSASLNLSPEIKGETKKRNGKYNAVKKEVDGIVFASTGEANRYCELKYQASLGIITHEKDWLQVPYTLRQAFEDENGYKQRAITYIADFVYVCSGIVVVEDFKGFRTKEFDKKLSMFNNKYKGSNLFLWVNSDKKAVFTPSIHIPEKQSYLHQYVNTTSYQFNQEVQ